MGLLLLMSRMISNGTPPKPFESLPRALKRRNAMESSRTLKRNPLTLKEPPSGTYSDLESRAPNLIWDTILLKGTL